MTPDHNAEAAQAAAEAVLGVLDGRLTATAGLGPGWLRSLAFDAACAAVDASTPRIRRDALASFAAEVDELIAEFTPGSHGGLRQYLAERAAFPAVREALKAVAGRARDIAEGAP